MKTNPAGCDVRRVWTRSFPAALACNKRALTLSSQDQISNSPCWLSFWSLNAVVWPLLKIKGEYVVSGNHEPSGVRALNSTIISLQCTTGPLKYSPASQWMIPHSKPDPAYLYSLSYPPWLQISSHSPKDLWGGEENYIACQWTNSDKAEGGWWFSLTVIT